MVAKALDRQTFCITNQPANQPTDQPTDTASYRDALAHLKRLFENHSNALAGTAKLFCSRHFCFVLTILQDNVQIHITETLQYDFHRIRHLQGYQRQCLQIIVSIHTGCESSDGNAIRFRPITSPLTLLHERVRLRLRFHLSLTAYDYDYEYTTSTTQFTGPLRQ